MNNLIIYVHGKGGSPSEAEQYKSVFESDTVIGFDYKSDTPWQAQKEFSDFFENMSNEYDDIYLIANSIGAYFSLCSFFDCNLKKAYLISPIVNMEKLICDMIVWGGITEDYLKERGVYETSFGQTLSFEYLSWARENPIHVSYPVEILYGSNDDMQSFETVKSFAEEFGAGLTVMDGGEHWFHTEEQMLFLYEWLKRVK